MKEGILHRAITAFNKQDSINATVLDRDITQTNEVIDAQVEFQKDDLKWILNAEVKTKIVPAQVTIIQDQMKDLLPYLIVAEYITTNAKQMLRKHKIPYMDTAGNVYLDAPGLYILVDTGQKNRAEIATENKAFYGVGLKVIYQFLVNPEYLNKSYRFISGQAMVTIDTVGRVIKGLLQEKFILKTNDKEYEYVDRQKLFREWVVAYNNNLRPKLRQNRFRRLEPDAKWQTLQLPEDTYWGGAVAADIVTDYLIADKGLIYTGLSFSEVMKKLKVVPDQNGDLLILEKFWKAPLHCKVVPHILIYADLTNYSNPRYLETANLIYRDHVQDQL